MNLAVKMSWLALIVAALLGAAQIEGHYRNPEYGYSVDIPRGLKALIPAPPLPQHGFRINAPGSADSLLWVDGSYNAAEVHSAEEILTDAVEEIRKGATIESVSRAKTRLGMLPAASFSIRYRSAGTHSVTIQEQVVAFRSRKGTAIIYILGMNVALDQYQAQRAVLDNLVKSFRTLDLPK